MSMLAERKRKIVYSVNPNGKSWSDDANGFGRRMLEKLGWTHGKGLGARMAGETTHVKVHCKENQSGVGYVERTDAWTEHEEQFSALLKSLRTDDDDDDVKSTSDSVQSLEMMSKACRSRVHYKKFTRGKDLARYSQKDLAQIFGRKTLTQTEENLRNDDVASEENVKFTHSGSMTEYFKHKMAAMRGNRDVAPSVAASSKRKRDEENHAFDENGDVPTATNIKTTKKKKQKQNANDGDSETQSEHIENDAKLSKKEKKRRRNAQRALQEIENPVVDDVVVDENVCTPKKCTSGMENPVFRDSPTHETHVSHEIERNPFEIVVVATKCKKKKKKSRDTEEISISNLKSPLTKTEAQCGVANPNFHDSPTDGAASNRRKKKKRRENDANSQKQQRTKTEEDGGVENPNFHDSSTDGGADTTSTAESCDERTTTAIDITLSSSGREMALDDGITIDIMMNVCDDATPSSDRRPKSILHTPNGLRRKSVRIDESRNQQRIIPHRFEGMLDDGDGGGGGIENAGFSSVQEEIDAVALTLDACEAEVENDINESKQREQVVVLPSVGLVGDQCVDEDCRLSDGSTQLAFKRARFAIDRPMAYPEHSASVAKKAYKHLITGDIVVEFNNSNLHEIAGYGNEPKRKMAAAEDGEVMSKCKKKHARRLEGVAKTIRMLQQQQQL